MRSEPVQRVIKGQPATVYSYPPRPETPNSAVTYRIGTPQAALDPDGAFAAVTTSEMDSVITTVATAASAGDTSIDLTAANTVTVRGHKYLIVDGTTGTPILVTASASDSTSDPMRLAEPLPIALAAGSTVRGHYVSVDLTAQQTADVGDIVIEWQASFTEGLSGEEETTIRWFTYARIVERSGLYTLNADTLTRSSPFAKQHQLDNDGDFSEAIDAAWRLHIRPALLAQKIREEQILNHEEVEPAHIAAVELYLAGVPSVSQEVRSEKRRELDSQLSLLFSSRDLWVATSSGTVVGPDSGAGFAWGVIGAIR